MSTKTITFKGILGKRELATYVDPAPGAATTDRVATPCGRCVNESGYIRAYAHVANGVCFECYGTGKSSIAVSTARRHAKQAAYFAENQTEIEALWAATEAASREAELAANFVRDWDEAHVEAAKRDAMVQGFVGNEGDKIANLRVTINVAKYIEGSWNRSSSMFVIATTDAGQVLKIFGSSTTLFGLQRDDVVTILTAKVKKHDWHDGQDQSVLSHVKMSQVEEVAA